MQPHNAIIRQRTVFARLLCAPFCFYVRRMTTYVAGTIAVIFIAQRTKADDDGYAKASAAMDRLARQQPCYAGMDSVRDIDGLGITVSYWQNDAAAKAWRDNAEHTAIREQGRDIWYSSYSLHVAALSRSYDWNKTS
jgi:heme-degrading monooxygenase HmoA